MNARLTLTALAAAAALTGCAGGNPSSEPAPERTDPSSSSSSTTLPKGSGYGDQYTSPPDYPSETAFPPPEPEPQAAKIGQSYTWTDGLKASVSKPIPATLTAEDVEFMGVPKGYKGVFVTVTVAVPKTGPAFDPAELLLSASSGDEESPQIFIEGADSPPSTRVQPGRALKTKVAFAVKDPKDVTVQVQAGWVRDPAVFVP